MTVSPANPMFDALFAPRLSSDAPLLIDATGAATSYATFFAEAGRFAHALDALGVGPGDRVAAQTAKSPAQLAFYAACLARGAVYLPLNTAYTADELRYFVSDAEPALVVVDPSAQAAATAVAAEMSGEVQARIETLDAAGGGTLAEAAAGRPTTFAPNPRRPDDLAAILYTSGTTGRSKGAMLTQDNLLSNTRALTEIWRFTAEDRLLHALPTFHTHGLFVACNIIFLSGASMIFLPRFDAGEVARLLPGATTMMGVPTFYTRLLGEPGFGREAAANVRLFISGSAPLLADTHAAFEARAGHRILERYGMTETGMNSSNPYVGERRPGAVGAALPGVEIRVTNPETGAPLPTGEIGMVEVRGPNVFKGYWRMPEKTAEELRADGFFITGDLGALGDDGYLTLVGRSKDLIISGGLNVYPKEVEQVIDAIPGVGESAVIGVPHADFGEGVVAVARLEPGAALDEAGVLSALKDSVAAHKRPKRVVFVDELPRNAMGKVQKKALREAYAGLFVGGSAG